MHNDKTGIKEDGVKSNVPLIKCTQLKRLADRFNRMKKKENIMAFISQNVPSSTWIFYVIHWIYVLFSFVTSKIPYRKSERKPKMLQNSVIEYINQYMASEWICVHLFDDKYFLALSEIVNNAHK